MLDYKPFSDVIMPYQSNPDLMHSVIMARQTRYLVPVAARLSQISY